MGRAAVIAALLLAWTTVAHADTSVYIEVNDITVEFPGDWERYGDLPVDDGQEYWNYSNPEHEEAALVIFAGTHDTACDGMTELTRTVEDPNNSARMSDFLEQDLRALTFCTLTARRTYAMLVAVPADGTTESIPMMTMMYTMALAQRDGFPESADEVVAEPTFDPDAPPDKELELPRANLTIMAPYDWFAEAATDGRDGDEIVAESGYIGYVMTTPNDACEYPQHFRDSFPDARIQDPTTSLPSAWIGLEWYVVDGEGRFLDESWQGIYCRQRDDGSAITVLVDPASSLILLPAIDAYLAPPEIEAVPDAWRPEEPSRSRGSVMSGIKPRTAHLALVRRSDDMGKGFGFGLQLGRMGWREGYRFTVGYEVAGAATAGFWELSAQVRPGFSPVTSDLPVDAYVALGVDAVGGKHQPETDVAPVAGVGAEVLFTLPGLGAELAAQALADPDGFHSYTLRGGLLFGANDARVRVGTNYVRFADDSTVLWMTLGMTVLELD